MEDEIKQDDVVATPNDDGTTAPVAPAVDAESTEEVVVEDGADVATEEVAAPEAGANEAAEDAVIETPVADQPAAE